MKFTVEHRTIGIGMQQEDSRAVETCCVETRRMVVVFIELLLSGWVNRHSYLAFVTYLLTSRPSAL